MTTNHGPLALTLLAALAGSFLAACDAESTDPLDQPVSASLDGEPVGFASAEASLIAANSPLSISATSDDIERPGVRLSIPAAVGTYACPADPPDHTGPVDLAIELFMPVPQGNHHYLAMAGTGDCAITLDGLDDDVAIGTFSGTVVDNLGETITIEDGVFEAELL